MELLSKLKTADESTTEDEDVLGSWKSKRRVVEFLCFFCSCMGCIDVEDRGSLGYGLPPFR